MFLMSAIPTALFLGFAAGYAVRALISRMRRQRWLRAQGR
jgi:NhaP-type Na+/H+ or K+/H+ antiporter